MRKSLMVLAALACLAGPAAAAVSETYDLLFREGTLDEIGADEVLRYSRAVSNAANPEAAARDTGTVEISFDAAMANLRFEQDGRHRGLGTFPASVGNPMIMYFYESVVRDMAETAGGSPFYIRNRVKEALTRPAEVVSGEAEVNGETVPVQTVTLRPFESDPNRARMRGFGDLELRVTMSGKVPGWYLSLVAEAPGEAGYLSELRFEGAQ
ncbi:hypothetical protein KO516_09590 [Citreicella sp. C3M06]|uniref:hypothetical protein n=1 Tax=Citreicella sp. C3M06 TaxID=2841564 RepID=UPI001C09A22B|nr:hypothetical protein [Citreicella sp. C3M06]MBU2961064.1 hypothetical protein [Citreicella sp. C3M06]